ncbi:GNAT family N-acetyltransferase [Lysinibacter sp. HNR]|nr:GNAT family N-acetyltransferase [Lysinibacter sp. HNR]WGD38641.1 GNAT family N-acetyltransferase [Lysinibacter sp. HNR]
MGYARVITDYAVFAWLCDVYIAPSARGNGFGLELARTVVETLQGMNVGRILLSTSVARDLYSRVGFESFQSPDGIMQLLRNRASVQVG